MDAKIVTETTKRVCCPTCGKPAGIVSRMMDDLLYGGAKKGEGTRRVGGPWYCDSCGWAYTFEVHADGRAFVEKVNQRSVKTRVLLRLRRGDAPIFVEVRHSHTDPPGDSPDERRNQNRYYFEEHTCPGNIMRSVDEVFRGDDEDPHGLFEFVEERRVPEESKDDRDYNAFDVAELPTVGVRRKQN